MTTYAVLLFTDGRRDCIERTVASFNERVIFPATDLVLPGIPELPSDVPERDHVYRWMFDDSADPHYGKWLNEKFPEWAQWPTHTRRGFNGTINRAWRHVVKGPHVDFVFHLEDDFTFNQDVFIEDMRYILDERPDVAQVALKRQPWAPAEIAAGGFMELWPEGYTQWSRERVNGAPTWVEQRLFFTTNPSLYRASLCAKGWPVTRRSEEAFSKRLFSNPNTTCAFLYGREHTPVVEHIGETRARRGKGY